eukprot:11297762-Karenia_brevis.AAC.1
MRHIQIRYLWVQARVKEGHFEGASCARKEQPCRHLDQGGLGSDEDEAHEVFGLRVEASSQNSQSSTWRRWRS